MEEIGREGVREKIEILGGRDEKDRYLRREAGKGWES